MEEEAGRRAETSMKSALESLKKDFGSIRTGRASLALLDGIRVDYYGTPTPLQQVASLSVPESRTILIQPWEPKMISAVEKSILKSDLGLTPSNDGKMVRISIPQLTEERRKELVKVVKKRAEEAKVSVRNTRRELNDELKRLEKNKDISADDLKKALQEAQELTDTYVKKVDVILQHKEEEIMEV